MYFYRRFKNGYAEHDPRGKEFAEYVCDNCGEKEWKEIRYGIALNETKPTQCPHCKSFGKDDYKKKLQSKINDLTKAKSNIEIQIEQITRELETIETKKE